MSSNISQKAVARLKYYAKSHSVNNWSKSDWHQNKALSNTEKNEHEKTRLYTTQTHKKDEERIGAEKERGREMREK